jgi:hypothetical protein
VFTADVLKSRPMVAKGSMQGQTFMGKAAVAAGMADNLVASIADALEYCTA